MAKKGLKRTKNHGGRRPMGVRRHRKKVKTGGKVMCSRVYPGISW